MSDDRLHIAAQRVDAFLSTTELSCTEDGECPYLPDRAARSEGFLIEDQLDGAIYRALMDRGFRRSGRVIYRPVCRPCKQCIPYRVVVDGFLPTKSMRRIWRLNADLRVEVGDGKSTDAKREVYARYQTEHHDGTMAPVADSFERFCYDSPVPPLELCYYLGQRLVGVSLLDVVPSALSSVYMYFDPQDAARSLGTYSILWEIEHCRARGDAYYYLGYYVPGSPKMAYKSRFGPAEVLDANGSWTPLAREE